MALDEWSDAKLAKSYPEGVIIALLPDHHKRWIRGCYCAHRSIQYHNGERWVDMDHVALRECWAYRVKPLSRKDTEIATIREKIAELYRRIEEIEEYEQC